MTKRSVRSAPALACTVHGVLSQPLGWTAVALACLPAVLRQWLFVLAMGLRFTELTVHIQDCYSSARIALSASTSLCNGRRAVVFGKTSLNKPTLKSELMKNQNWPMYYTNSENAYLKEGLVKIVSGIRPVGYGFSAQPDVTIICTASGPAQLSVTLLKDNREYTPTVMQCSPGVMRGKETGVRQLGGSHSSAKPPAWPAGLSGVHL
uniref:Lipocln_cytosolic_FA-bd_dom domain-containing protein n=1 Tax=Macrostomum lignano TaxID=282301 RepID=A0A1I8FBF5_9PLAT